MKTFLNILTYINISMKEKELSKLFKALADETRIKILKLLAKKEMCVCEIVPRVGRKQSTVSIHLAKLENLGIVESRKEGQKTFYRLKNQKIKRMLAF